MTPSGEPLKALDYVRASVVNVSHEFVVVNTLVAPVILGIDFLQRHQLILDFATTPVSITTTERECLPTQESSGDLEEVLEPVHQAKAKQYHCSS